MCELFQVLKHLLKSKKGILLIVSYGQLTVLQISPKKGVNESDVEELCVYALVNKDAAKYRQSKHRGFCAFWSFHYRPLSVEKWTETWNIANDSTRCKKVTLLLVI